MVQRFFRETETDTSIILPCICGYPIHCNGVGHFICPLCSRRWWITNTSSATTTADVYVPYCAIEEEETRGEGGGDMRGENKASAYCICGGAGIVS